MPISSRIRSRGTTVDVTPTEARLVARMLELGDVRRRIRELEVADLAEVAIDRLVGDEPLHQVVRVERLAVERRAGLLAVALDELAGAPLVAGVDDAAVPGRGAPAERVGLEQVTATPRRASSRAALMPGISATDDDDVRRVRQLAPGPIGQRRPSRRARTAGARSRG